MTEPFLQLRGVGRGYHVGDETVDALKHINLDIHAGEMVAIVGVSGSGKSTLMNILGCLDRPTSGTYLVDGLSTAEMSPDELAELRRAHFGFIFQRYHLLGDLSAAANVEVPALYAGLTRAARRDRARALLRRLGMGDRVSHKPSHLSGGQQQRVSIARALMNGGKVILADEPTGALDSHSGEEVMKILAELNAERHTIIIVTHDAAIASHAQRIIELHDGVVISDQPSSRTRVLPLTGSRTSRDDVSGFWASQNDRSRNLDRFIEALRMAALAMAAHRVRTFLTMLGIIIGIASVVSAVALGNGSRQRVLADISALGTNTIDIYPGAAFGDMRSSKVQTLRATDAIALAAQSYIDSATPSVSTAVTARFGNTSASAQISGVGEQFFRVRGTKIVEGTFFSGTSVSRMDQVMVIDQNTRDRFFADKTVSPIGKILLLNNVPSRIIGVTQKQSGVLGNNNLMIWMPYTTVLARMLGQSYVSSITVRVGDETPINAAEQAITQLLTSRHGGRDFSLSSTDHIRRSVETAAQTMTLLIGAIAAISLVVGGVGVMNIMLVSVIERTKEIGVRMAVGGRQSDILQQFLMEAVLLCLVGGVIGVSLAFGIGYAFSAFNANFQMIFSTSSIVAVFASSTLIGIVFGFLPARNAARLDPVEALARE